jgi:hypothetical protein
VRNRILATWLLLHCTTESSVLICVPKIRLLQSGWNISIKKVLSWNVFMCHASGHFVPHVDHHWYRQTNTFQLHMLIPSFPRSSLGSASVFCSIVCVSILFNSHSAQIVYPVLSSYVLFWTDGILKFFLNNMIRNVA